VPALIEITDPRDLTHALRAELTGCWAAVTNAGGAAGFRFPPVSCEDVAPVADALIASQPEAQPSATGAGRECPGRLGGPPA
jgi:hypothetical protein